MHRSNSVVLKLRMHDQWASDDCVRPRSAAFNFMTSGKTPHKNRAARDARIQAHASLNGMSRRFHRQIGPGTGLDAVAAPARDRGER